MGDALRDTRSWYDWKTQQAAQGRSLFETAALLSPDRSPIARLRAATLLERAGHLTQAMADIKVCLKSGDRAIRVHALALLIFSERESRTQEDHPGVDQIDPAIRTLEPHLNYGEGDGEVDDFYIETQVVLKYNLCRLYFDLGKYDLALAHAGEAIYLSLPLETPQLTFSVRMSYARAALRLGQIQAALREYQVINTVALPGTNLWLFSGLNVANILLMLGDHAEALTLIDFILGSDAGNVPALTSRQYICALSGLLAPEEAIQPCRDLHRDQINAGLQALIAFVNTGQREGLTRALELFKHLQGNNPTFDGVIGWAQSVALLNLGQIYLSAQRIMLHPPNFPVVEALVLGMKLDIALQPDGIDLEPPAQLCQQLQQLFRREPSRSARLGLAEILTYWHPKAAAFCAFSPHSVPELVDATLPSVFVDGRPIRVHGQAIATRLPFLQMTLETFGIDAAMPRDQSTERERMASALTVGWGAGTRQLPVIPPALLIFHYVRVAEQQGGLWRMAARELARTHGTVPKTFGGHLRQERTLLADLLGQLLDERINVKTFQHRLAKRRSPAEGDSP